MNKIQQATYRLAQACEGSPISTTVVVMLFFVMFNVLEATVEKLVFGERFEHFLDPIFGLAFIGYSAYAVYWCAVFNSEKNKAPNVEFSGGAPLYGAASAGTPGSAAAGPKKGEQR